MQHPGARGPRFAKEYMTNRDTPYLTRIREARIQLAETRFYTKQEKKKRSPGPKKTKRWCQFSFPFFIQKPFSNPF
jgi:hypothetical protein